MIYVMLMNQNQDLASCVEARIKFTRGKTLKIEEQIVYCKIYTKFSLSTRHVEKPDNIFHNYFLPEDKLGEQNQYNSLNLLHQLYQMLGIRN